MTTYVLKMTNHEGDWFLGSQGMWCDDYNDAHHYPNATAVSVEHTKRWVKLVDENGRPTGKLKILTIRSM